MNHWTKFDIEAIKEFKKSMESGVETVYFKNLEEILNSTNKE